MTLASGKPLPNDKTPASLLLPMGRNGPAFLAYQNFQVYLAVELVAGLFDHRRLSRDAARRRRRRSAAATAATCSTRAGVKEVQTLLKKRGYDVGKIDGVVGLQTRAAIKAMQIKFGLPADSYPSPELLAKLRGG